MPEYEESNEAQPEPRPPLRPHEQKHVRACLHVSDTLDYLDYLDTLPMAGLVRNLPPDPLTDGPRHELVAMCDKLVAERDRMCESFDDRLWLSGIMERNADDVIRMCKEIYVHLAKYPFLNTPRQ